MSTKGWQFSSKIFLIGTGMLVLLAILIFAGNQFASADALMKGQKATQSLSEHAQSEIDSSKKLVDQAKNPTDKAELEKGWRLDAMQGTQIAAAQTKAPTTWAVKQTLLAKPTQKTTPKPTKARVYGLKSDFTNIYLDRSVDMALGAWSDSIPGRTDQAAVIYYSGVKRKSNFGVVIRLNENPDKVEEFIVGEETGKIKIVDKQGDFLVLQNENGDPLYFNVVTNEFTHSMEGKAVPLPSTQLPPISPTNNPISPTETLQAYP